MSRRFIALFAMPVVLLGGCQTITSLGDHTAATLGLEDEPHAYTASMVSEPKRTGIAVADEPLAARAGAAALADEGTAIDAVATMFFTLTATYPVAAGLGGGGICCFANRRSGDGVRFVTKAQRPAAITPCRVRWRALPPCIRLYGALPWQRIVAPGEAFASTGFPISQALARASHPNRICCGAMRVWRRGYRDGRPRAAGVKPRTCRLVSLW